MYATSLPGTILFGIRLRVLALVILPLLNREAVATSSPTLPKATLGYLVNEVAQP